MTTPSQHPRKVGLLLTPAHWLVGLMALGVVFSIAFVLFQKPPRADRIWEWIYPNSLWSSSGVAIPHTGTLFLATTDSFTNVSSFYRARMGVGGMGTIVQGSSSPFFGDWQTTAGINSAHDGMSLSDTLLTVRDGQFFVVHISRPAGATNTFIRIAQAFASSRRRGVVLTTRGIQELLAFAGTVPRPVFAGRGVEMAKATINTNAAALSRHYETYCIGLTNAPLKRFAGGNLIKLDLMPGVPLTPPFPASHPVYFYSDPGGAGALIMVHANTNGTAELGIAAGTF